MILLKGHSDRAVQNHRHVTGATDTYWLNELVRYVRGQGLWDQFVFYPMMPKTNYGTGSQVRPLGGLTANSMQLTNGPTWTSSGVQFVSGNSQYGSITDDGWLGSETLTVFMRQAYDDPTPADTNMFFDMGSSATDLSRRASFNINGELSMQRSSDGTAGGREYATNAGFATTNDVCAVFQWVDGGGRSAWKNKSSVSLSVTSSNTSAYDSTGPVNLYASFVPSAYADCDAKAVCFLTGTITDTQRETITDLINMIGKPPPLHALREYVAETGATNTLTLDRLTRYISDEGLWDNFALYSMTDGTNYGSGSSVAVLGGLTSNAMTLVNGPTWGASGLAFASASSQYGTIPDFLGSETLTVFARTTNGTNTSSAITALVGQFDVNSQRSFVVFTRYDLFSTYQMTRSSDGGVTNAENYTGGTLNANDETKVFQWVDGGGRSFWQDKSSQSLSLISGSAQTTKLNTSVDVTFAADLTSGSGQRFSDQTAHALAFLTGTLTDTQRETITDLINAL